MSSTEQHPEVTADESGNESPPVSRAPDWPKKIRTLTATELDRLTIDGAGRFYWDGRLVNYEPPESKATKAEPPDRTPVEAEPRNFDDDHKPGETIERTELDRPADARAVAHRDDHLHDLDDVRAVQHRVVHHSAMGGEFSEAVGAPVVHIPDRVRITLTRWQSLGAILVVLCLLFGSLGVAALGFATAYDWGCRTGLIQTQCPAMPRPSSRSDIPA
ncbi:MAG TPA: hypothetical protein VIU42_02800 [Xanthobacteraceae bacterium]